MNQELHKKQSRPAWKKLLFFSMMVVALLFSNIGKAQTDPPQFGTPFTGVPDIRDVNMYQVHNRPYSAAGNFAGITARLDSIKALGVNVVYVMPIYPHGADSRSSASPYSIQNFETVASEYGTLTDFQNLVAGCHSRGMAVILDFAVNGTSWDHAWITAHPTWYVQSGGAIQQLANFSDVAALNFTNTDMRAALVSALRYWIFAANIDGYRCDFANNPPPDFWTNTIANLRGITTHKLIMLAEGDRQANYTSGFDYDFGDDFYYDAIQPISTGGSVSTIQTTTNTEYASATGSQQMARYTSNHDVETSTTAIQQFGGHNGVIANYLVCAYMRGVPFLTSGQEVDFNQTIPWPYTTVKINWTANLSASADFKKVNNYRTLSEAVRRGTMTNYSDNNTCAFTKASTTTTEKVVVMVNMRNSTQSFVIPSAFAGTWKNSYTGASVTLTSGATQSLTAFQYIVLTNQNVATVAVTGVTMSPTTASIAVGSTQQLTATIAPANATNQNVTWSSSNTAVATVGTSGIVTAVGAGTATITVTTADGSKTATCAITAATVAVTGVTMSPTTASINTGGTQQLTATIAPANASNKAVTWTSSNTAIATVSATGLVTAVAAGTATITVKTTDGSKTATCAVTVTAAPTFTVYFFPPAGWGTGIKIYWWSALPSGVLADGTWPGVSMSGPVNGWYSYTFTNVTSTNLIFNDGSNQTVNLNRGTTGWYENGTWYNTNPGSPVAVTGVTVSPTSATLAVAATQQLTATIAPSNATNTAATWSSSNTAVATVSSTGLVTAVAAGTATITVTTSDGSKTATSAITVSAVAVTAVTLSPTTASLTAGSTQQLTATVAPSNATNKAVTYASSNTAIATVNSTGLITALAAGTATITVTTTSGSKTATCVVTVTSSGTTTTYYNILNRWQANTYLYDGGNGQVKYGTSPSGNNNYQWAQVTASTGYILIVNRGTGNMMNVEDQNGAIEATVGNNTWYSAMWSVVSTGDGWNYLENRWQTSDWINIQALAGYAQYSGSATGFYSAEWQFVNGTQVSMAQADRNFLADSAAVANYNINTPTNGEPLVHSALSPNGDGVNDVLTIDNIANYPDNKIMVMNTGGTKVFESAGYNNTTKTFDGHSSITGAMVPQGTYFYVLQYKAKGITKTKTGYIVLKY
jgi:gliding motility-associated-like protein